MISYKLQKDYTEDGDTDGHDVTVRMSLPASRKRVNPNGGATPETPRQSIPCPPPGIVVCGGGRAAP